MDPPHVHNLNVDVMWCNVDVLWCNVDFHISNVNKCIYIAENYHNHRPTRKYLKITKLFPIDQETITIIDPTKIPQK